MPHRRGTGPVNPLANRRHESDGIKREEVVLRPALWFLPNPISVLHRFRTV